MSGAWKVRLEKITMAVGIIVIASNLRAPITSVGPVITEITENLKLSHVLVGLITAIPLISFGLLSIFIPNVARKWGIEKSLLYSLLLLAVGLFARSYGTTFFLFLGAAFIGIAITVGNVLMPAFIKKEFPGKTGLITAMYLVSMNLTSALAVGYSIQIGQMSGLGWKGSIGIWVILALLAFLIWIPQVKNKTAPAMIIRPRVSLWKSRLAWNVAFFMGLQSFMFYILAAWLPTILQSWGMSAEKSGWMLSYVQMGQIPMMLIGPIMAARMKNQTPLIWGTFLILLIGISGIISAKAEFLVISVVLMGVSLGMAFALATMFFVLRTKDSTQAASLSGMAQSVGYLIAACGPPIFGALFSLTGTWYASLMVLVLAAIALFITGLSSAKNAYIPNN